MVVARVCRRVEASADQVTESDLLRVSFHLEHADDEVDAFEWFER